MQDRAQPIANANIAAAQGAIGDAIAQTGQRQNYARSTVTRGVNAKRAEAAARARAGLPSVGGAPDRSNSQVTSRVTRPPATVPTGGVMSDQDYLDQQLIDRQNLMAPGSAAGMVEQPGVPQQPAGPSSFFGRSADSLFSGLGNAAQSVERAAVNRALYDAAPFFREGNLSQSQFWGGQQDVGAAGPSAVGVGTNLSPAQQALLSEASLANPGYDPRKDDILGNDPGIMRSGLIGAAGELVQGGYGITEEVLARALDEGSAYSPGASYNDVTGILSGEGDVAAQADTARQEAEDAGDEDRAFVDDRLTELTGGGATIQQLPNGHSVQQINAELTNMHATYEQWEPQVADAEVTITTGDVDEDTGRERPWTRKAFTEYLVQQGYPTVRAAILGAMFTSG
ncbi:MAG: hypothetical protein DRQ97_14055 [Gammaproteobacteria bacterium]|nr:MAG: hypothetical protein DRQ97_14055 [Gammaproteobacteria bacterium]